MKKMTAEEWKELRSSTLFNYRNHHDSNEILHERLREIFEEFNEEFNEEVNGDEFDSIEKAHEFIGREYRNWKKYGELEGITLDIGSAKLLSDHWLVYEGKVLDCLKFAIIFNLSWDYDEITCMSIN